MYFQWKIKDLLKLLTIFQFFQAQWCQHQKLKLKLRDLQGTQDPDPLDVQDLDLQDVQDPNLQDIQNPDLQDVQDPDPRDVQDPDLQDVQDLQGHDISPDIKISMYHGLVEIIRITIGR